MPLTKTNKNTLVCYDYFQCLGGAENVTLVLSEVFEDADIMVAYTNSDEYPNTYLNGKVVSNLGVMPKFFKRFWPTLKSLGLFYCAKQVKNYKNVIFSGTQSLMAVRHRRNTGNNLYYCHTPPRYAFDQYERYKKSQNLISIIPFIVVTSIIKRMYKKNIERMDVVVANSKNVQKRLSKFLNVDSKVVYPPVDIMSYRWIAQGNYFVSTARLEPLKRVDMIIKAFINMPQKRLVVLSGGSQEKELKALAKGARNIEFKGWVSEQEKRYYIGNSLATIYIPVDEDFGISPIESMAAEKPVLGVDEGGLSETVLHKQSGYLLQPDFKVEDLIAATEYFTRERCIKMRSTCRVQAGKFSKEVFAKSITEIFELSIQ